MSSLTRECTRSPSLTLGQNRIYHLVFRKIYRQKVKRVVGSPKLVSALLLRHHPGIRDDLLDTYSLLYSFIF